MKESRVAVARPTSRDVARLAGVAQSTVSNALADNGSVSPATREKVLRAARDLRYSPNLAARSMRTRRSGRVAVVMGVPQYNPSLMLAGVSAEASSAGYTVEVHTIDGDLPHQGERIRELAALGAYEGILCFVPVDPSVAESVRADLPLVTPVSVNEQMRGAGALADATPVVTLIEHLAHLGHRRFLHVAGPDDFVSAVERRTAYAATVERLGLESLGIVGGDWTATAGIEAVHALPSDTPPLAVIAANDLVAVGVMRAAAERGWTVPGHLSVTGWDDYEVSPYLTPSLTTVHIDRAEAGRREMRRLVAVLRHEPVVEKPTGLTTVVWRESTAAPLPWP